MVNVLSFGIFILTVICLTSSLPVVEESSTSKPILPTVSVKENEENLSSVTENSRVSSSSESSKDAIVDGNKIKETPEEHGKEEIIDAKPVEVKETLIPVSTNGSKDVYVIKTIVYEVGILTEADNGTSNDTESHEEVNLTFFDPKRNESVIDLSNIPVPIQTNISGVSITGLAPANFGTIQLPEGDRPATLNPSFPLPVPLLSNAVISVKHNISTTNVEKEAELLSSLPNLLGLTSPITGEPLKVETSTKAKAGEHKQEVNEKIPVNESESSEESSEESKEDTEQKIKL